MEVLDSDYTELRPIIEELAELAPSNELELFTEELFFQIALKKEVFSHNLHFDRHLADLRFNLIKYQTLSIKCKQMIKNPNNSK